MPSAVSQPSRTSPAAWVRRWPATTRWPWWREAAGAGERLQHRGAGFLDLQEERVALVAAEQQRDPGPGADAADPDHLVGGVDVVVALGQDPGLLVERVAVLARAAARISAADRLRVGAFALGQLVDRHQQRRPAGDPQLAVAPSRSASPAPAGCPCCGPWRGSCRAGARSALLTLRAPAGANSATSRRAYQTSSSFIAANSAIALR